VNIESQSRQVCDVITLLSTETSLAHQQLETAGPLKADKTPFDLVAFILPGHATDSGLNVFEVLVQVNHKLDQCSHPQNPSSAMPVSLLGLANELLLSIADSLDSERSINAIMWAERFCSQVNCSSWQYECV
jgi:hypothetical protein